MFIQLSHLQGGEQSRSKSCCSIYSIVEASMLLYTQKIQYSILGKFSGGTISTSKQASLMSMINFFYFWWLNKLYKLSWISHIKQNSTVESSLEKINGIIWIANINVQTWRPSPSSIFLASVISGILSFMGRGYPKHAIIFGLLSKSHMLFRKRCMPGGTHALKSLGCAKSASGGGCSRNWKDFNVEYLYWYSILAMVTLHSVGNLIIIFCWILINFRSWHVLGHFNFFVRSLFT